MPRSSVERVRRKPRRLASVASSSCCVVRWLSVVWSWGIAAVTCVLGALVTPPSWMMMRGGGVALACSTGLEGGVVAAVAGVGAGFLGCVTARGLGFGIDGAGSVAGFAGIGSGSAGGVFAAVVVVVGAGAGACA